MQTKYDQILEETKTRVLGMIDINEANQWVLDSNKDGYTVYTKLNPDNGLKINRTQTEAQVDFDKLVAVAFDATNRKKYDDKMEDAQLIEQIDQNTAIFYLKGKPPVFMVDSRDFVIVVKKYQQPDGTILLITKSVEHATHPPVKGTQRGEIPFSCTRIQQLPGNKVNFTIMGNMDMKGDIPKAITNQGTKFQAESVKKLIEFVQKQ